MGHVQGFRQKRLLFLRFAAAVPAIFLCALGCQAQSAVPQSSASPTKTSQANPAQSQPTPSKPAGKTAEMPWTQDFASYPGLLDELGHLVEKLQQTCSILHRERRATFCPRCLPARPSTQRFPTTAMPPTRHLRFSARNCKKARCSARGGDTASLPR